MQALNTQVIATADLHRHHNDKYISIDGRSLSLGEWFESALSPRHVDLVLFAGDLGLECNEELPSHGRWADRRASGAGLQPLEKDEQTIDSWNALLDRILRSKPEAHVVVCAGNHDGLLCADDYCLACRHLCPP